MNKFTYAIAATILLYPAVSVAQSLPENQLFGIHQSVIVTSATTATNVATQNKSVVTFITPDDSYYVDKNHFNIANSAIANVVKKINKSCTTQVGADLASLNACTKHIVQSGIGMQIPYGIQVTNVIVESVSSTNSQQP